MSAPLPSPEEAMLEAVLLAKHDQFDGARLWLDIARELRLAGSASPRPIPRPLDREASPAVPPERVTHLGDDSLLPICGATGRDDPGGLLVSFTPEHVTCAICLPEPAYAGHQVTQLLGAAGEHASQRFERLPVPVPEPEHRAADTAVLGGFALPPCAYCNHELVWITPGATPEDGEYGRRADPHWAHALTQQRVCPAPTEGQSHTFATPSVDERG